MMVIDNILNWQKICSTKRASIALTFQLLFLKMPKNNSDNFLPFTPFLLLKQGVFYSCSQSFCVRGFSSSTHHFQLQKRQRNLTFSYEQWIWFCNITEIKNEVRIPQMNGVTAASSSLVIRNPNSVFTLLLQTTILLSKKKKLS